MVRYFFLNLVFSNDGFMKGSRESRIQAEVKADG